MSGWNNVFDNSHFLAAIFISDSGYMDIHLWINYISSIFCNHSICTVCIQIVRHVSPQLKYSINTVSKWLVIRSFNYCTLLSAAIMAKNWAWSGQNLIIGLNRCDVNRWSFLRKPRGCLPSCTLYNLTPLWTASHSIRGFMFYERGWISSHICNWQISFRFLCKEPHMCLKVGFIFNYNVYRKTYSLRLYVTSSPRVLS